MVKHHAVFGQKFITLAEECFQILWSYVFHHSHRNDSIELTGQVSIILLDKGDI